jgi:hypothetical protein
VLRRKYATVLGFGSAVIALFLLWASSVKFRQPLEALMFCRAIAMMAIIPLSP